MRYSAINTSTLILRIRHYYSRHCGDPSSHSRCDWAFGTSHSTRPLILLFSSLLYVKLIPAWILNLNLKSARTRVYRALFIRTPQLHNASKNRKLCSQSASIYIKFYIAFVRGDREIDFWKHQRFYLNERNVQWI